MATLLTVLKITGISAAIILLLVLLFIVLLLLIPFRYDVKAQFHGTKLQLDAAVRWDARAVRLWYIQNLDETHDGELLLFGFRLLRMNEDSDWLDIKIKEAEEWLQRVIQGILNAPEGPENCLRTMKRELMVPARKKTVSRLLRRIIAIVTEVFPRSGNGVIEFGLEDPFKTGQLLQLLAVLYPFYGRIFDICPNFETKMFLADLNLKGRARIGKLIRNALMLLFSRESRDTYHEFMRLTHNE